MNTINNIGASDAVKQIVTNPIYKTTNTDPAATATAPSRPADRVELSGVSQFVQSLKDNNIRTDKVASVRAQIDAGNYEDDAKLNAATDKLLDDLSK